MGIFTKLKLQPTEAIGFGPQTGQLSERLRPRWGRRIAVWPGGVSVPLATILIGDVFSDGP